jgi:hypothetical protein
MRWPHGIRALALYTSMMGVALSACVIRIGTGGDEDLPDDAAGGSAGGPASAGSGAGTPEQGGSGEVTPWSAEEQQAIAVIEGANPDAAIRSAFIGEYTASGLAALLEASAPDPAAIDVEGLAALVDQYAPGVLEDAGAWAAALDESAVQAATITPKPECEQSHGRMCSPSWGCLYENIGWSTCILTGCGKGACPTCPSLFDLDALIVQKWCSYTCVSTKDQSIVGIAIHLKIALNGSIEKCFLFDKPVTP